MRVERTLLAVHRGGAPTYDARRWQSTAFDSATSDQKDLATLAAIEYEALNPIGSDETRHWYEHVY
jgi:hypothetical protein